MTEQHKQHYCYRAVRLTAAMCRLTFSRFGHYCIAPSSQRVHCEVNSSIMAELILHFSERSFREALCPAAFHLIECRS